MEKSVFHRIIELAFLKVIRVLCCLAVCMDEAALNRQWPPQRPGPREGGEEAAAGTEPPTVVDKQGGYMQR